MLLKGYVRFRLKDVKTGKEYVSDWKQNLITTAGMQAILENLGNVSGVAVSNAGRITYGAVGTSTIAVAAADTRLGTELDRATVSYQALSGTELTLHVYFNTSEANGDIKEFAWFGEAASGTANSGTMFNHIAVEITKTSSQTLTIEQKISLA